METETEIQLGGSGNCGTTTVDCVKEFFFTAYSRAREAIRGDGDGFRASRLFSGVSRSSDVFLPIPFSVWSGITTSFYFPFTHIWTSP